MDGQLADDGLDAATLDRIDRLEQELGELRAQIRRRRPADEPRLADGPRPVDEASTPTDATVDRRSLLGKAGAVAAGALAASAGATIVDAAPASADTIGSFSTSGGLAAVTADVVNGSHATAIQAHTGTHGGGLGVFGQQSDSIGIFAISNPPVDSGFTQTAPQATIVGVNEATTGDAAAVVAQSVTAGQGWGLLAKANHIGAEAQGDHWDLRATKSATIGFVAPGAGVRHGPQGDAVPNTVGDLSFDGGNLWYCTAAGTGAAATFRKVSGFGVAGSLHLLSAPVRVYDSRLGGEAPLVNDQRTVSIRVIGPGLPGAGRSSGIFTTPVAGLINLTATNTVGSGWLAVWSDGIPWPGHSNLNWNASGNTVANECTTATTPSGGIIVKAAGRADFIVDVIGYYR